MGVGRTAIYKRPVNGIQVQSSACHRPSPGAKHTAVPVLRPRAHHGAWPWVRSPSSSAESGSWVVSKASRLPWPLRTVQGMGSGASSPVLGTSLLLQACFPAVDSETRTEQWVSCCLEKTQCIWYFTILPNISRLKNQVLLILLLSLEQIYLPPLRNSSGITAHSFTPFPPQKLREEQPDPYTFSRNSVFKN